MVGFSQGQGQPPGALEQEIELHAFMKAPGWGSLSSSGEPNWSTVSYSIPYDPNVKVGAPQGLSVHSVQRERERKVWITYHTSEGSLGAEQTVAWSVCSDSYVLA